MPAMSAAPEPIHPEIAEVATDEWTGTIDGPRRSCGRDLSLSGQAGPRGGRRPRGLVPTLNGMGFMLARLDEISQAFVEFAAGAAPGPALDVGAAYGVATLAALRRGAHVIANDIEPRHLEILQTRVPAGQRPRLTIRPGAFPGGLESPAASLGAVLLARVMHFFDGPTIERSVEKLNDWLRPGGTVFVVVESSVFLEVPRLRRLYESRRRRGQPWPGFVRNLKQYVPERADRLPDQIHYLDEDELSRCFVAGGFQLERIGRFLRSDNPDDPQAFSRESIGLIAAKSAHS